MGKKYLSSSGSSEIGPTSSFLPPNMVQDARGLKPSSRRFCATTIWLTTQLTTERGLPLPLLPGSHQYVTKASQSHAPEDPLHQCWESLRRHLPAWWPTQLHYEPRTSLCPSLSLTLSFIYFLGSADVCPWPAGARLVNGVYKVYDLALDPVNLRLFLSHSSRHARLCLVLQSRLGTGQQSVLI